MARPAYTANVARETGETGAPGRASPCVMRLAMRTAPAVLVIVTSVTVVATGARPSTAAAEPASCVDGAPYDAALLRARVAYLASAELDGRAPGTAGDAAAR